MKSMFQKQLRKMQELQSGTPSNDFASVMDRVKEARHERIRMGLPTKYNTLQYRRDHNIAIFLAQQIREDAS